MLDTYAGWRTAGIQRQLCTDVFMVGEGEIEQGRGGHSTDRL